MKTKRQFFAGPPLEKLAPSGLREAEKANIPFVAARFATLTGALRRCSSLVWLATRRSERLALHPASAPKNGILTISASLRTAAPGLPAPAWTARRRGAGSDCASAGEASALHKVLSKSGEAKSVGAISL